MIHANAFGMVMTEPPAGQWLLCPLSVTLNRRHSRAPLGDEAQVALWLVKAPPMTSIQGLFKDTQGRGPHMTCI
jgi:hypothetical protein